MKTKNASKRHKIPDTKKCNFSTEIKRNSASYNFLFITKCNGLLLKIKSKENDLFRENVDIP